MDSLSPPYPAHEGLQLHESKFYNELPAKDFYKFHDAPEVVPIADGIEVYFKEPREDAEILPEKPPTVKKRCGIRGSYFWVLVIIVTVFVLAGAGVGTWIGITKRNEAHSKPDAEATRQTLTVSLLELSSPTSSTTNSASSATDTATDSSSTGSTTSSSTASADAATPKKDNAPKKNP